MSTDLDISLDNEDFKQELDSSLNGSEKDDFERRRKGKGRRKAKGRRKGSRRSKSGTVTIKGRARGTIRV